MGRAPSGTPRSGTRKRAASENGDGFGRHGDIGDNIKHATPAQIATAVKEVMEGQAMVGRAAGRLGGIFKKWEDDCGIDRKVIKAAIEAYKMTPEEATRQHAEVTAAKIAIGAIPPLADDAWTKGVKQAHLDLGTADGKPLEDLAFVRAEQQGFKAGMRNKPALVNPYNASRASLEYTAWTKGHKLGVAERLALKPETTESKHANPARGRKSPAAGAADADPVGDTVGSA